MDQILTFILSHCSFLYNEYSFRFMDSKISDSFGGDAYLDLGSETIIMRLTRDRGQLFLEFRSAYEKKQNWYSIDLIRKLITGEKEYHSIMDEENAKFLENNFTEVVDYFSHANLSETLKKLEKLKLKRSKDLFG